MSLTQFLELTFRCTQEGVVQVESALRQVQAASVSLHNGEPSAKSTVIDGQWSVVLVKALLPLDADIRTLHQTLAECHCTDVDFTFLDESKWLEDANQIQPTLDIGCFSITSEASAAPNAQVQLVVTPGMAFGTGEHETTALCLEWLGSLNLENKRVLDLGCGTGILAIAAKKRGAALATAIDNDQLALDIAKDNAARNKVELTFDSAFKSDQTYDVIVSNIFADTLVELAPQVLQALRPHGELALSGILASQVRKVTSAYADIAFGEPLVKNAWVLLRGRRKAQLR